MKPLIDEIAAMSWRKWLSLIVEFISVIVIVASIAVIAIGFSPT